MPSVEIQAVSKSFGATQAVHAVDILAKDGQFTTLLGPSGCGKTTTLRILAGFEEPDEGMVRIGDRVVCAAGGPMVPPEERHVGMVFQSYALWPHMTVAQNIGFPLVCQKFSRKEIRERTERVLALVKMMDLANRYPSQLSGGQQQRVSLARALAYDPVLLLLDEPLANLDAKLREEMRLELRRLQEETKITTIYVTHDQVEAMVLSDQLILMNEGRVVQFGEPYELYSHPSSEFAADFLGLSNLLEAEVLEFPSDIENSAGLVKTETGEKIRCHIPFNRVEGDRVILCIRPEDLDLVAEKPHSENIIEGKVQKSSYLGETWDIWVETSNFSFRVRKKLFSNIQPGNRVFLSVDPKAVKVLPASK